MMSGGTDPFLNTNTRNILKHTFVPKIVSDVSGDYTLKTDVINVDNIYVSGDLIGTTGVLPFLQHTSLEWSSNNPILQRGKLGLEIETGRFKIGDGTNNWNLLKYFEPIEDANNNITIGASAGSTLSRDAISIGRYSGSVGQENYGVSIGCSAGSKSQQESCISIGRFAGNTNQGTQPTNGGKSIAIGDHAGFTDQNEGCISIGSNAGKAGQGQYSIAIGTEAAGDVNVSQHDRSIILNATGSILSSQGSGTLVIKPIRGDTATNLTSNGFKNLYYNPSTGEIAYSTS